MEAEAGEAIGLDLMVVVMVETAHRKMDVAGEAVAAETATGMENGCGDGGGGGGDWAVGNGYSLKNGEANGKADGMFFVFR